MVNKNLLNYKYLIFDVYGTLVDWETGLYNALQPLLHRFRSSSKWTRREALQAFGSVELDIQAQNPTMLYSDLLAKAHEVLQERLAAADNKASDPPTNPPSKSSDAPTTSTAPTAASDEHVAFGQQVKQWDPFPDSAQALKDLAKFYKLIVLSNVDHRSFAYTHSYLSEGTSPASGAADTPPSPTYTRPDPNQDPNNLWLAQKVHGTKSPFSLIMTAQDTGAYKPSLIGFNAVFEAIRADSSLSDKSAAPTVEEVMAQTLIVAQSLTHDHAPAQQLGITSVWIDRQIATLRPDDDGKRFGWTWRFETLGDMAKAVEAEAKEN